MNSSANFVRAIRGPILMITLGVILAVDHFGPFGFSRTWPVLIIVVGVMKLLERTFSARPLPDAPSDAPAGSGGSQP